MADVPVRNLVYRTVKRPLGGDETEFVHVPQPEQSVVDQSADGLERLCLYLRIGR